MKLLVTGREGQLSRSLAERAAGPPGSMQEWRRSLADLVERLAAEGRQ